MGEALQGRGVQEVALLDACVATTYSMHAHSWEVNTTQDYYKMLVFDISCNV
jgi:hypothetical protein